MSIKLQDNDFDIIMLGFRPGSVIAYFTSLLQKQEPIDVDVMQAYLSQILKSKFGDQTEVTVQSKWYWNSFFVMVWGLKCQISCSSQKLINQHLSFKRFKYFR